MNQITKHLIPIVLALIALVSYFNFAWSFGTVVLSALAMLAGGIVIYNAGEN